jgi:hypothetical protein
MPAKRDKQNPDQQEMAYADQPLRHRREHPPMDA